MKKVVIAPDSFKGTLSSGRVCEIIARGIKNRYPDVSIRQIPVADGGEGTAEAFLHALGGERIPCTVKSPLGRDIEAYFVMLPDKTAVIEMALASGLTIEQKNNALTASTYGTGQLIKKALSCGAERLVIGIGGSATTDAGTGCLAALGAVFYDQKGEAVYPSGENLCRISKIDLTALSEEAAQSEITVLCDVTNPLYGENGAAYIYAPQKGATKEEVALLDRGLEHFAKICKEHFGKDYAFNEGAGAAGGMGFALTLFLNATLKKGAQAVLDICDFEREAEDADLIITGEGKMDSQSLMGKVPFTVAQRSKGKRVIAFAGVNELDKNEYRKAGISAVIETNPERLPFDRVKALAEEMLLSAVAGI